MDDALLLKRYVDGQDQEAFANLVGRHGGWLNSAARRQLRDGHLAEDVTQAVFLLLSRRAKGIAHTRLSGWLFLALGYCIRETKRRRMQQIIGEKEAASMRKEAVGEARWEEVAPELDEAVAELRGRDQEVVLLRFYEQRSLAEVGRALGISEEAAKKRVQRAVEKLRERLGEKGITGTTAGLSAVLVANVVEQMPKHLLDKIVSAVGSGGGNTVAAGIAKGAMKMITLAKVKVVAVVMAAVLVVGVGAGVAGIGGGTRPASEPAVVKQGLNVQVLLPDGTPAAGAEVYLPRAGADSMTLLDPGAQIGQRRSSTQPTVPIVTGADGRFTLPAGGQLPKVVVVHLQGIAEIVPGELRSDRVTLQPWGRIEGQLSAALRTGAGQEVGYFSNRARPYDEFQWSYSINAPVDADGKFVIDRVPPGLGLVSRLVSLPIGIDHTVPVDIGPGKRVTIGVGGTGPDVTAKVEPPAGSVWQMADTYAYVRLWKLPCGGPPDLPAELRVDTGKMDMAQTKGVLAAASAWAKTPEGHAWMAKYDAYDQQTRVTYAGSVREDGAFDLVQIPPGKYRMRIDVMTQSRSLETNSQKQLGWLLQEVVVPEEGAGKTVDLGHFVVKEWKEVGGGKAN